ncbi:MAG TPA: DUF6077 domain-containing protein [Lachnospiraceae bacterium]|nr:DUF6077 domain-containing protein [Lachnospiraceae bacterium]
MQTLQQVTCFILWLGLVPLLAGVIPSHFIEKKHKSIGLIYLCGFFMMFAVFQLTAVPFIVGKRTLTELSFSYTIVMEIISVAGLIVAVISIVKHSIEEYLIIFEKVKRSKQEYVAWIIFLLLLIFQMVMSVCIMTPDGDDAYYVSHAVISDQQDSMFLKNSYTGGDGILDFRHVLAPFPMFIAMLARKSGMHAAAVAHTILPVALIGLTYLVYWKLADLLFEKKQENVPIFLVLISGIQIFGNYSVYTSETFFLTRTWQGKSILANLVIPFVFFVLMAIIRRTEKGKESVGKGVGGCFFLLLLANLTGALASSLGLLLLLILEGVFFLVIAIRNHRLWLLPCGLLSLFPCYLYILLYVLGGA